MADNYLETLGKTTVKINGRSFEAVAASFRGAAFFVRSNEQGGGGRTIVTKKVPFSAERVNEDFGANVPSLSMEFFLVGVDCDVQKNALLKACGQEGAAELVHPWLGTFQARCSDLSFTYGGDELGVIRGTITFVEESALPEKSVSVNLAGETKAKSKSFREKLQEGFAALNSDIQLTAGIVNNLANGLGVIMDLVTDCRKILSSCNDFISAVGKIKANAYVLIRTPGDFAARVSELVTATEDLFSLDPQPKEDVNEYLDLAQIDVDTSADYTGILASMVKLVRTLAATMVVDSLVDAEFASVDEAREMQTKVTEAFDNMIAATDDVEEFMALSDLQATALMYLRETMANMAVVVEKTVRSSVNILTLAYDVYGDLDRVEDIMARNCMSQGMFVTGPVKMLSK